VTPSRAAVLSSTPRAARAGAGGCVDENVSALIFVVCGTTVLGWCARVGML
jgi:hypothetical protein